MRYRLLGALCALLVVTATVNAGAGLGAAARASAPPGFVCTPQTALIAGARDAACWPFASTSPWNTAVGASAVYQANGGGTCSAMISDQRLYTDIASDQWSHPTYIARSSDPLVALYTSDGGGPVRFVGRVRVPVGARPADPSYAQGGDAHLHLIEPHHRYLYEQWHTRAYVGSQGAGWLSDYENTTDLYSTGVGAGGVRAYGGSALGGLIRSWELQAGAIRHPLAVAIQVDHQTDRWVWPATANDGWAPSQYTGSIPMGQLFAIPKSYGLDAHGNFSLGLFTAQLGLKTRVGVVIALAARNYGAYLVDSGGDFSFYTEPWAKGQVAPALNTYDANGNTDAGKIRFALRCITNNTPRSPGGGGKPLAASPPPLASLVHHPRPRPGRPHRHRRHAAASRGA